MATTPAAKTGELERALDDVFSDYGNKDADGTYTTGQYDLLISVIVQTLNSRMTGQEWYDNFISEYKSTLTVDDNQYTYNSTVMAAKRAAGLES